MSTTNSKNLISTGEAARICDFSRQYWLRLHGAKRIPEPEVVLPRITLWDKKKVLAWNKKRQEKAMQRRLEKELL